MYIIAVGRRAQAIENALQRYLEDEPNGLFAREAKDILKMASMPAVSERDLISWARDREDGRRYEDSPNLIPDTSKRIPASLRQRVVAELVREIQR